MSNLSLCVLGAGVVGMTTAIELQKKFRGASITILSDQFFDKTTSFVSPGLFYPGSTFKGPTEDITNEWNTSSFNYWNDLKNGIGLNVGVAEISGYHLFNSDPNDVKNIYVGDFVPEFRQLSKDELDLFEGNWKYGYSISTLLIENGIYLPWATNKFLNDHGKIHGQKIEQFSELAGKYDVVVNCTGLGAKFLCNDENIMPVRGQICKVNAPWVDKFYYLEGAETQIVPGFEGVTLGTTFQYESFDKNWDEQDELDIKQRCQAILPNLKNAQVIAKRVGLRPHRNPVRVEHELLCFNTGTVNVVHNYGHCSNGVTAAPGTAKHAVRLVQEALSMTTKK